MMTVVTHDATETAITIVVVEEDAVGRALALPVPTALAMIVTAEIAVIVLTDSTRIVVEDERMNVVKLGTRARHSSQKTNEIAGLCLCSNWQPVCELVS